MSATSSIENEPVFARAMDSKQAANYTGLSEGYLRKSRCKGYGVKGPNYRKVGKRVIYLRSDLDAFLDDAKQAAA